MYYRVEEDTLFLLDHVRPRGRILEIGAGSGYISFSLARMGYDVTATDIDDDAIEHMKDVVEREKIDVRVIKSDLFDDVDGEFDTIIFNPPYLPGDADEDVAIYGGREGEEVIYRFLKDAYAHLKNEGSIFIILSSYNNVERMKERFNNYEFRMLDRKNFFFHSIYVYELKKR
ncbi:MAG: HemK2/MTQ2 family protein methyltransferase [Thermoplasmata archaeon]|jgi:release factor glutamine methyltransferase|nr:MAG: hypothetical protein C0180_01895 [Aciduliprofundum sp.]